VASKIFLVLADIWVSGVDALFGEDIESSRMHLI